MSSAYRLSGDRYFVDAFSREHGGTDSSLDFLAEEFVLPARLNFQQINSISYTKIHSIIKVDSWAANFLLIGIDRAIPVLIRRVDVADPASTGNIATELTRRVSIGPGGSERLVLIRRRQELFRRLMRPPWFVLSLVGLFVALFAQTSSGLMSNPPSDPIHAGVYIGSLVGSGELHRLVTAGFFHWSAQHLALNSLVLVGSGWIVEAALGARRTALLLLVTSVSGYGAMYALPGSEDQFYIAKVVGSSSAVWGLLWAAAFLSLRNRKDFPVGFRSHCVLWSVIASQAYWTLSSEAVVAHLAGGLSGLFATTWLMRGGRTIPLLIAPPSRLLVILAAIGVVIACREAIRREYLSGDERYLALIHERLSAPPSIDRERNNYAWSLATAGNASEQSLDLALETMKEVVGRDPSLSYRDTLATLLYRVGDYRESLQVMREVWREDPDRWSATQLARFYDAALNGPSAESGEGVEEVPSTFAHNDVRLEISVSGNEIDLGVLFDETRSEPSNIHALIYTGDELQGFVEIDLEAGRPAATCHFHENVFAEQELSKVVVRPVWEAEQGDSERLPSNSCVVHWLHPSAKYIP